jgi:hypothetical protein
MSLTDKQILRFALADHAFREAHALTQHLLANPSDPNSHLCSCSMAGIAVCYCRPFMSATGLGPLPDEFRKFPAQDLEKIHRTVFEARNKLTAHMDMIHVGDLHAQGVIQNHPGEVSVHLTDQGPIFETTATYLHPERLPAILALCEFQIGRVGKILGQAGADLLLQRRKLGTLTFRVQ